MSAQSPIRGLVPRFGRRATDKLLSDLLVSAAIHGELEMPKAQAEHKMRERKQVERRIGKAPKHTPALTEGVDDDGTDVVESSVSAPKGSIFDTTTQENLMAKAKPQATEIPATAPAVPVKTTEDKVAAASAKEAERVKKAEEAAEKKANRAAELQAEAEKKAVAKAEREKLAAERKAEHEAHVAELKAAGRKYTGSMLSLAERVKAGAYVKSMTGQLRTTDELAEALDAVPPENVVKLGMIVMEHTENKYAGLNIGQQSMNYRNLMRGKIKRGETTLSIVRDIRDQEGFATAEAAAAERAAKKAEREQKAAEAKALKEKAQAEAKAKKEEAAKAAAEKKAAPKAEASTPAAA